MQQSNFNFTGKSPLIDVIYHEYGTTQCSTIEELPKLTKLEPITWPLTVSKPIKASIVNEFMEKAQ